MPHNIIINYIRRINKTVGYSNSSFESIVSSMTLYFDGEGAYFEEFEKPFMEKFPEEYKRMVKELNDLK